MAIFNDDQTGPVFSQIMMDAKRFISGMGCELSSEELKELYVDPEHRELLTEAYNLSTHKGNTVVSRVMLTDEILGKARVGGFILPHYFASKKPYKESEAYPKLEEWTKNIQDIIGDFVNLQYCFGYLNRVLSDPKQFGFYLPSLSYLLRTTANEQNKTGNRQYENKWNFSDHRQGFTDFNQKRRVILARKGPGTVPPIAREIVEACNKADALILRMMLIGDQRGEPQACALTAQDTSRVSVPAPWHKINPRTTHVNIEEVRSELHNWNPYENYLS